MKSVAAAVAAAALLFTLVGCSSPEQREASPKEQAPVEQESTQNSEAPEEAPEEAAPAEPTSATVADGYPQEWIDLNLPAIEGLSVTGKHLPESGQTRVVGDAVASDETIKAFTDELVSQGWVEQTPGKEYVREGKTTHVVMIDVELGQFSTFTIWSMKVG